MSIKHNTSALVKLSVHISTLPEKYPSPIIQCAIANGVNKCSILSAITFIYLPSINLYHDLCRSDIHQILLVENQYCLICGFPALFGQGVGGDLVHMEDNTLNFK